MPQLPLLSANAYLAPADMTAAKFADLACAAGFQGVAWNVKSCRAEGAEGLAQISAKRGLRVTSLNSAGYFTWMTPQRQAKQDAENLWLIEQAARLGADRLVIITGGIDGGLDAPCANTYLYHNRLLDARARVRDGLAKLDARAAELGLRLALELIHPVDQLRKGVIHSVAEGLNFIKDLAQTDLALDAYHSAWDLDFHEWPQPDLSPIGLFQICNTYEPQPDAKPLRALPDEGRVDLEQLLKSYAARGFTGALEFEMFDHHRQGRSVEALLQAAFAQLNRLSQSAWSVVQTEEGLANVS